HLRHDERHTVREPERRRLVDAERTRPRRDRHELAARRGSDGEQAHVEVARREGLRRRLLDDEVAEPRPRRPRRREGAHVLVPAPIRLTFPRSSRADHWTASRSRTASTSGRSSAGAEKTISGLVWTIVSTFTLASASAVKSDAALMPSSR